MMAKLITLLAIAFMIYGLWRGAQLVGFIGSSRYRLGWRLLLALIATFLAAYIGFLVHLVMIPDPTFGDYIASGIFLFGALFVSLVIQLYLTTYQELNEATAFQEGEKPLRAVLRELQNIKFALDQSAIVATTDRKGKITYVNDTFCEISKYSRDELLGQDHRIVNSGYHTKEFMTNLWETIGAGKVWRGDIRNRAKDGSIYWVDTTITPLLDHTSKPSQYVAIRSDITDKREAQDRLAEVSSRLTAVLDSATEFSIMATDLEGTITVFNQGAKNMLGYSEDEMVGLRTPANVHLADEIDEHARRLGRKYGQTFEGFQVLFEEARRGSMEQREWTYCRKDGTRLPVSLTVTSLKDYSGTIIGFLGIATDLTERRRYEKQLAEARDAALQSAQAKADFLANMSHEIRTPMNGVIGMTNLLMDTELTTEQRDYAETIQKSGEALLTVINDILDFSKMEAGKLRLENIDFEVREVIEDVIQMLAVGARSKDLELVCLIEDDVPLWIEGDPGRLRQILTNLLGNAIKFTGEGSVIVAVALKERLGKSVVLHFEVRDTGIGIPEEAKTTLFQPFSQAEGSTTRRFGGTGLGLAISRDLVHLMQGEIGVESVVDEGSTFWFTARFREREMPARKGSTVPGDKLEGLRVLIVDDNDVNRAVYRGHVARWRMEAATAENGKAGLAKLREAAASNRPFHIVLLDLQMPEMDGLEVARTIRVDPSLKDLRIMMLSSTTIDSREEALRCGVDAYYVKPVRETGLYQGIVELLSPEEQTGVVSPAVITQPETESSRNGPRQKILVAEDNPVNQKVIQNMLQKLGFSADIVPEGRSAVQAWERGAYDLVLLDCQMPVLDGYEAVREIRRRERGSQRTPVIAVTANALRGDREKALAAGMDDYLPKPVRLEDLQKKLSHWLGADTQHNRSLDSGTTSQDPIDCSVIQQIQELQEEGKPSILNHIIDTFLSDAPNRLKTMQTGIRDGNIEDVRREAHALKGSSRALGATALGELLETLERELKEGQAAHADSLFAGIVSEYGRVKSFLESQRC